MKKKTMAKSLQGKMFEPVFGRADGKETEKKTFRGRKLGTKDTKTVPPLPGKAKTVTFGG